jgi:hypothetical protein
MSKQSYLLQIWTDFDPGSFQGLFEAIELQNQLVNHQYSKPGLAVMISV